MPTDVTHGIAPTRELPVKNCCKALLIYEIIPRSEILVHKRNFFRFGLVEFGPSQAPFQNRPRFP